ncbi:MAG: hypothetical protein COV67_14000 [Nitrospinae bacterium CG11_big_fil_rev_8_21_14_0_20_56_8]|nr:MAG: hypothetical protein COV67_14000 [Nitrospinae bacterium CG11_big_fil_rev_8_21_14_0_20_56_8]
MNFPRHLRNLNLYSILEIDDFSEFAEIKRGYCKAALKYHPDRFPDDQDAAERFMLCTEAYAILREEEKRRTYDRMLRKAVKREVPFQKKEFLRQRKKSIKRVYSPRYLNDYDYNLFLSECRRNFWKFLKDPSQFKVSPKYYTRETMVGSDFDEFVEECRDGFQDYLKSLPQIRMIRSRKI